jgi:hypothetical protein
LKDPARATSIQDFERPIAAIHNTNLTKRKIPRDDIQEKIVSRSVSGKRHFSSPSPSFLILVTRTLSWKSFLHYPLCVEIGATKSVIHDNPCAIFAEAAKKKLLPSSMF